MSSLTEFESREVKINQNINAEVDKIRGDGDFELPKVDAPIVGHYVQKIEGTYDVDRAKEDTDNAVDLLYIAYNTTPQEEGDIRVKISAIMDRLIKAQQDSERTARGAIRVAESIHGALNDFFPDWLDVKDTNDPNEIKSFVAQDLRELTNEIKEKATGVQEDLNRIAENYDAIIDETANVTSESEKALSKRLKKKEKIEKEIREAEVKSNQIELLVKGLQEDVAKFERMAQDFGARAETAEDRSFIMSIIQVGAQVLSSVVPIAALAGGGGGSYIAASTLNTANKMIEGDGDNTDEVLEIQKQLTDKKIELDHSKSEQDELNDKLEELKKERDKLLEKASTEEDTDMEKRSVEITELEKQIEAKENDLRDEKEKHLKLNAALKNFQNELNALKKSAKEMTEKYESQASSLREMQMKMLDKVEAYEKEKRAQSAELIKINALLAGKRTEEETIQLAIRSLNLSLVALKAAKAIIVEISVFFKSFADFMGQISDEAAQNIESIDRVANRDKLRKRRLERLILSTDVFFIRQAGEWNAVIFVSDKFARNFADGWSKLNSLSGTYITGDKLQAYFETAKVRLQGISNRGVAAADRRIELVNKTRDQVRSGIKAA